MSPRVGGGRGQAQEQRRRTVSNAISPTEEKVVNISEDAFKIDGDFDILSNEPFLSPRSNVTSPSSDDTPKKSGFSIKVRPVTVKTVDQLTKEKNEVKINATMAKTAIANKTPKRSTQSVNFSKNINARPNQRASIAIAASSPNTPVISSPPQTSKVNAVNNSKPTNAMAKTNSGGRIAELSRRFNNTSSNESLVKEKNSISPTDNRRDSAVSKLSLNFENGSRESINLNGIRTDLSPNSSSKTNQSASFNRSNSNPDLLNVESNDKGTSATYMVTFGTPKSTPRSATNSPSRIRSSRMTQLINRFNSPQGSIINDEDTNKTIQDLIEEEKLKLNSEELNNKIENLLTEEMKPNVVQGEIDYSVKEPTSESMSIANVSVTVTIDNSNENQDRSSEVVANKKKEDKPNSQTHPSPPSGQGPSSSKPPPSTMLNAKNESNIEMETGKSISSKSEGNPQSISPSRPPTSLKYSTEKLIPDSESKAPVGASLSSIAVKNPIIERSSDLDSSSVSIEQKENGSETLSENGQTSTAKEPLKDHSSFRTKHYVQESYQKTLDDTNDDGYHSEYIVGDDDVASTSTAANHNAFSCFTFISKILFG
jgi:hypothetical protein